MLYWDPDPVAFRLPIIQFEVYWYSLLFGFGFLIAYALVLKDVKQATEAYYPELSSEERKSKALHYTDRLAFYIFFAVLIGARLGHVLFYDWNYFSLHPEEIFTLPMRGLASHGAAIGILITTALFLKTAPPLLSPRALFDSLARAAAFAGGCIRLGNFMNQEILGTPSTLPWAVTFGHPAENIHVPCHPVQLYEALFYFLCFFSLTALRKKLLPGMTLGLFCLLVFGFRFFIEFLKLPQGDMDTSGLHMGQLLSIPAIFLGCYILSVSKKISKNESMK